MTADTVNKDDRFVPVTCSLSVDGLDTKIMYFKATTYKPTQLENN